MQNDKWEDEDSQPEPELKSFHIKIPVKGTGWQLWEARGTSKENALMWFKLGKAKLADEDIQTEPTGNPEILDECKPTDPVGCITSDRKVKTWNTERFNPYVRQAAGLSSALLDKIQEICNGELPPVADSLDNIFIPRNIVNLLINHECIPNRYGAPQLFGVLVGEWITGMRILGGFTSEDRSSKTALTILSKTGLVVYDKIQHVVVLNEQNLLNVLEEIFPS